MALLAWMVGLLLVQHQSALLPGRSVALAAALVLMAAWLCRGWRWAPLLWVLAAGVSGFGWANGRALDRVAEQLDVAWEGRDLQVPVRIDGLPAPLVGHGGVAGWRLPVRVLGPAHDASSSAAAQIPHNLSLTWFEGKGRDVAPRAGERWQLTVRLKRIQLPQNPGLPDTELWLLERGIRAQGSVRSGERLAAAPWWRLSAWRESLRDAINRHVPDARQRAVLAGLVIGDQASLPANDWALLRDAGVVHLFSISGLHITVFAWAAAWLVRGVWRRSPWLTAAWAAPSAARHLGFVAALAYALLSGWGVPAQRTVGLMAVVTLLASTGRSWPWPLALLFAGSAVGLADPWALSQPGFWLSFVAVGLLMNRGATPRPEPGEKLSHAVKELLRTQATVTIGLLPLTLLFFGQVSVIGVLANLVAVPVVTLALVPLALLGAVLPLAWTVAGWLIAALWAMLQPMAALPWAVAAVPQAPWGWMALALLGTGLALQRLPRWLRLMGLCAWVPMLAYQPPLPPEGSFRLMVVDVGQGSAVWLQTARHNLLFDSGPRWGPIGQDAGARYLVPMLRAQGVDKLDLLAISHADSDHSGGAASVALALPVQAIQGTLPPDHPLNGRTRPCAAGETWVWDGVRFSWLHPLPGAAAGKTNAIACVLQVRDAKGRSALLTADIEAAQEAELLARSPQGTLAVDLLLVPHHGSNTSSTTAFIDAVTPSLALAQSGYRNRHGHPALPVLQRFHAAGVPVITSAGCGAFDWWSAQGPPTERGCWRDSQPRYWHNQSVGSVPDDVPAGPELWIAP